jgi:DNA repair exonuclease SbcCD ATPase subunit
MTQEDEKKLEDYVAAKGEVFYLQAAQDLGIPRSKIKSIARALETKGRVSLKYDPGSGTKLVYAGKATTAVPAREAPGAPKEPAAPARAEPGPSSKAPPAPKLMASGPAAKAAKPAEAVAAKALVKRKLTEKERETLIKTTVDTFVEYVYLKGEVNLPHAANYIGVSQVQAEEWAKVLEAHDIIDIKYSPIHGMLLIAKPISEDEMKDKLRDFESRKSNLDMLALKLEQAITKYEKSVPAVEKEFEIIEEQITEKLREAEDAIKKLDELEKAKKRFLKGIRDIHTEEEEILKMKASIINVSEQSEDAFNKSKKSILDIGDRLKTSHDKLFSYEQEIKDIERTARDLDEKVSDLKYDIAAIEKRSKAAASGRVAGGLSEFLAEREKKQAELKQRTQAATERAGGLRKRFSGMLSRKPEKEVEKIEGRLKKKVEGLKQMPSVPEK